MSKSCFPSWSKVVLLPSLHGLKMDKQINKYDEQNLGNNLAISNPETKINHRTNSGYKILEKHVLPNSSLADCHSKPILKRQMLVGKERLLYSGGQQPGKKADSYPRTNSQDSA